MGYGILRMFEGQARRYFPLSDYDLTNPNAVELTIYGQVLDPKYTRLLIQKTDLPLEDILALDRVQKHQELDDPTVKRLRRAGLIEGRRPNLYVSASVAEAADMQADYIRTRPQDDAFYKKLITDYIKKFGSASRKDIEALLLEKLSEGLPKPQKRNKVSNLLASMSRSGKIRNVGPRKTPKWVLAEKAPDKSSDSPDK